MKLTANSLFTAALVAATLLTSPAQAQSSAISEYKLQVNSTLVLGQANTLGTLRVLNNGPADTQVRWFNPKVGAWETQLLTAGQSLLSERGAAPVIARGTLVCLVGQAASSKEKAGFRATNGYFSMPLASPPEEDEEKPKPTIDSKDDAKQKPKPTVDSKDDAKQKPKPTVDSKDDTKQKPKPTVDSKNDTKKKPKQGVRTTKK